VRVAQRRERANARTREHETGRAPRASDVSRQLPRGRFFRYAHPISRARVTAACRLLGCRSLNNRYGYLCAHLHCRQARAQCFRVRISIGEPAAQRHEIRGRTPVSDAYCPREPACAVLMNARVRPFRGGASLCGRLANHTLRCCHSTAVGDLNAHRARRDPCSWVSKDVTLVTGRFGLPPSFRPSSASSFKTRSSSEVFDVE
jgi:hypothetical protein